MPRGLTAQGGVKVAWKSNYTQFIRQLETAGRQMWPTSTLQTCCSIFEE